MKLDDAYQYTIQHVKNPDDNLYEIGMREFSKSFTVSEKESILLRLIAIYPQKSELYFKMALLFSGDKRSFAWHNICFTIDANHKENIIVASQTLYANGLGIRVFDYISSPCFSELLEDNRFLSVYSRCNFQQLYYKDGVSYLLKLIQYYSNKPAITMDDKIAKWSNYHDLGYVYCMMSEIVLSLKYTKKALELADKFGLEMHQRLLSFSNFVCYHDFTYYDPAQLFRECLKINDYLNYNPMFSNIVRRRNNKIRIGYISSDFSYHPVANFIVPILENHSRSRFDIILYANQSDFSTDIFTKIPGISHRIIKDKHDIDVAKLINSDQIDILIDLNGHTVGNRMGVLQFGPSPVQITYLGYPNTTGLKSIQYRITDSIADPFETEQPYSERLIRLPRCFLLYKYLNPIVPINQISCNDRSIIFGSINKENKTSSNTLDTWGNILAQCPNTKILIKLDTFDNETERLAFYMNHLRTSADRIIIVPKLGNVEYNAVFSRIDILLDPFPYSGTTTTCNALFNSIPVVTLYHKGFHAHNVSASILSYCGLDELIARTREQYISIVTELVSHPEKINAYKRTVHSKFKRTIMDPVPFMRSYESALIDTMK